MTTFNVTFNYFGNDWFLCAKSWTEEPARASSFLSEEAASAALAKARRYMRNKQLKAHIVALTPAQAPPPVAQIAQDGMPPNAAGAD